MLFVFQSGIQKVGEDFFGRCFNYWCFRGCLVLQIFARKTIAEMEENRRGREAGLASGLKLQCANRSYS